MNTCSMIDGRWLALVLSGQLKIDDRLFAQSQKHLSLINFSCGIMNPANLLSQPKKRGVYE